MDQPIERRQEVPLTEEEVRLLNSSLFEKLASSDPLANKEAQDAVSDFVRYRVREEGIIRQVLPPIPITDNTQLTREPDTDKPARVVDMEPDSPAAVSVGFATWPDNWYIRGRRFYVTFHRIETPRFTKDVAELRTWEMDIRQVLSDNAIKDMLAEEDGRTFSVIDAILVGPGAVLPTSGVAQWVQIAGTPSVRNSLFEAIKVLPRTPSSLEAQRIVTNHITVKDFSKMNMQ